MEDHSEAVCIYHQASKHHADSYPPDLQTLEWASRPNSFRHFQGSHEYDLPLIKGRSLCAYDDLYGSGIRKSQPVEDVSLGLFFELSLGISAWRSVEEKRWALRNNHSSGNLNATEGYLLLWRTDKSRLSPGLYHYNPYEHTLEQRATLPPVFANEIAAQTPGSFGAIAFSSILWRDEWQYGARAYRYCELDVGHALVAARFAARINGWLLTVDRLLSDDTLAACIGTDRDEDFTGTEEETPNLVALLSTSPVPAFPDWAKIARGLGEWQGKANASNQTHTHCREISEILPHVRKFTDSETPRKFEQPISLLPPKISAPEVPFQACEIIRQRRSAEKMDSDTYMLRPAFERMLARTLPQSGQPPFDTFPFSAAINLVLFVHRIDMVTPGL